MRPEKRSTFKVSNLKNFYSAFVLNLVIYVNTSLALFSISFADTLQLKLFLTLMTSEWRH